MQNKIKIWQMLKNKKKERNLIKKRKDKELRKKNDNKN